MNSLTNLQLRVISGGVLAVAVLAMTWAGGFWFRLLAVAIGAGVHVEWRRITQSIPVGLLPKLAELLFVAALAAILAHVPPLFVWALIVAAALTGFAAVFLSSATVWLPIGILYAGMPAASLAFMRGQSQHGLFMVLFLFAIVWATDIFAYFVGRSLGGPKLAPKISPGKTWSGAIGGIAAAVAAGLALASYAGPEGNFLIVIVIVLVSIVSQSGDLFESWVKRRFGVKDSGTIIPGHGGVMDRVDGLAVAAVALYLADAVMAAF